MTLPAVRDLVERGLSWHRGSDVLPELVVHPATADEALRARYGPKVGDRRAEYELLGSEELAALWRQLGVEHASPTGA